MTSLQNLFIAKLPRNLTDDDLLKLFEDYKPSSAKIMLDAATGKSKGFGFVLFPSEEDGRKAYEKLNKVHVTVHGHSFNLCIFPSKHDGKVATEESNALYIRNIPRSCSQAEVEEFLKRFGNLTYCAMREDHYGGPVWVIYAEYETIAESKEALSNLHGSRTYFDYPAAVLAKYADTEEAKKERRKRREGHGGEPFNAAEGNYKGVAVHNHYNSQGAPQRGDFSPKYANNNHNGANNNMLGVNGNHHINNDDGSSFRNAAYFAPMHNPVDANNANYGAVNYSPHHSIPSVATKLPRRNSPVMVPLPTNDGTNTNVNMNSSPYLGEPAANGNNTLSADFLNVTFPTVHHSSRSSNGGGTPITPLNISFDVGAMESSVNPQPPGSSPHLMPRTPERTPSMLSGSMTYRHNPYAPLTPVSSEGSQGPSTPKAMYVDANSGSVNPNRFSNSNKNM
ncbi:RNA recognition motif. (a.k.a. RRM, RBD, or RNP domain), putative [Angomonas deanei]|uniref:RNA recognition motif. (A.k.a. RRM, RBD, or RNP domain), putative n=1 Tax=Angomonas deanei TaxID=59799 RepID=A0A7G2CII3_9TRYP|nr:RNA recognition motif. (a.k.a. RRM, RBD, or RNP domain), putative [Angomonas deanei]